MTDKILGRIVGLLSFTEFDDRKGGQQNQKQFNFSNQNMNYFLLMSSIQKYVEIRRFYGDKWTNFELL